MIEFDRGTLLASGGGLALTALTAGASGAELTSPPPAPVAKVAVVNDTYFGETLPDPYRWMENDKDPDWLPFLKAENDHARAVLDAIPGRAGVLRRIQQLSGDTALTSRVQRAGGRLFFQQRPAGADNFKLFVREGGRQRVLVDPTALSGSSGHTSLDWWRASPDGSHLVYGLSRNGSEDSLLHVLAVADGRDLPDQIPNTQAANPQWLDDGSGFFYNQLTAAVDTPDRFLDSQARFHRLGADPATDPIVMKRGLHPEVRYERIQAPYILTFQGSSHVILSLGDVRPESRMLIAPVVDAMAGAARWTPVAVFEDEVTDADIHDGQLYLLANKGTPRGRIVRTPITDPSLANATQIVPQGPVVIEGIARAQDGLYLQMMDGGIGGLRRLAADGKVAEIKLPFDGSIGGLSANLLEEGVLMNFTGWLTPAGVWSADAAGDVADTGLTPKPDIDVSAYDTIRGFAPAKDGVRIPYTLIYRKGLKRDGSTPAWISAYGSYGVAA